MLPSRDALKKYVWVPYAVGLVVLGGWYFGSRTRPAPSQTPTDREIARYEAAASVRRDARALVALANAYLQKVRETADFTYYQAIDELMREAGAYDPNDPNVLAVKASVALGRHEFSEALGLAESAIAKNRDRAIYYGLRGDAELELGRYDEAAASFQKMVDLRPDFASFSRIAYLRELHGDIEGAKDALRRAVEAGAYFKENIAWGYVESGKLEMRSDLGAAEGAFREALNVLPDYPPAFEGLGKIFFARGDPDTAIRYFSQAFEKLPIAQYAIDLGDVADISGDTAKAGQYFELAKLAFAKSVSSGVNTDLEEAIFLADRDLDLGEALAKARSVYALRRTGIYAADALAWALHKNGKSAEAAAYSREALRLGEYDPLILFHAGIIAEANGDGTSAKRFLGRALEVSPYFSIRYADLARQTLAGL